MDYRKRSHRLSLGRTTAIVILTIIYCSSALLIPSSISAYNTDISREEIEKLRNQDAILTERTIEIPKIDFSSESDDDVDPLSSLIDANDIDPLSNDILSKDYINVLDLPPRGLDSVLDYEQFFEYNLPFTTHFDRDYSSRLTELDYLVLTKIIVSEIGNCTFEQIAASAAMCLNRLYDDDFPDTMFENAIAPMQFRESYGYAPWPEPSDKVRLAIKLALCGIDFSCNAVGFYTPEYSSKEGCKYFEEYTYTTAEIKSKCEGETSVFVTGNEKKEDAINAPKYIYSKSSGTVVRYN